jgi:hypothetical protein
LSLQTEFEFTLPKGYVDGTGTLHRAGVMRLATARDEVEPLRDARVQQNEAYLTIIVLARVVERLGTITQVTPHEIESLFSSDLAYLQELYGIINFGDSEELQEFRAAHGEVGEPRDDAGQPEGDEETPGVPFGRRGGFVEEVVAGE